MSLIPLCPADCTPELPAVAFATCPADVEALQGEISYIYLTAEGYPLSAYSDLEGVRVDNSGTNADVIRKITVMGDKPAPEAVYLELSLNRRKLLRKNRTLNIVIDDVNDTNHEALRLLECGSDDLYLMWYEDSNGYIYGGLDGIPVKYLELNEIIPQSRDEKITFTGVITWESKYTEERFNPNAS